MQRRLDYAEKPEYPMNTAIKTALAFLLFTAADIANAEELGRLFFTPQQRVLLERGQQPHVGEPGNISQPDRIDSLTLNGIVQKHGGERTVWINGVPQPAGNSKQHAPESEPVTLRGQSHPVEIKVGQRVVVNPVTDSNP
jgi:hypothetical protein